MNNRSRKLLDLAHAIHDCQNCGAFCPEGCEPAHMNGILAGKGLSIKGQDNRHAALCHSCHLFYDTGSSGQDPSGRFVSTRGDKFLMWTQAHLKTFDLYWKNNWLCVTGTR